MKVTEDAVADNARPFLVVRVEEGVCPVRLKETDREFFITKVYKQLKRHDSVTSKSQLRCPATGPFESAFKCRAVPEYKNLGSLLLPARLFITGMREL